MGSGLGELSQSVLLVIPWSFKARDVPHILLVKPSPCVNGITAASRIPHGILGQLPLGFPNSSPPFLASSDKKMP